MSRVLVVCADRVGPEMAGPGIRAFELASVLAREHQVTLLAVGGARMAHPRVRMADGPSLPDEAAEALARGHDVAVVQGAALRRYPLLASLAGLALVVDLYDPFLFEILVLHRGAGLEEQGRYHADNLRVITDQLAAGDFFLCASERQRDYWLGMLAAAGRLNPRTFAADPDFRNLIDVVPFGVPESSPGDGPGALKGKGKGIRPEDVVLLWGGGIWNWLDPLTVIRAVGEISKIQPAVKLFFLGTRHPNPVVGPMRMTADAIRLSQDLGLYGTRVFFNQGWVPYAERAAYLRDTDVGVTAHLPSVETRYGFRTRVLDYLWAGLPVIATEGDELAELVRAAGIGRVVGYGDVAGWASAIAELVTDQAGRLECAKRAREVSEQFRWTRVAEPLIRFCREPRRAADRPASPTPFGPVAASAASGPGVSRSRLHRARIVYRREGALGLVRRVVAMVRRLAGL